MADLSEHFDRSEFACKCGCGFDTVDAGLLQALEAVRSHFDAAVYISSGCRCESWNLSSGGVDSSQHLLGRASDITVAGYLPEQVAIFAEAIGLGGIGRYETFTHIDSRNDKARW